MERSIKQYETDRKEAAKIAARLILASGTTAPRVGGVGECTFHVLDDECDIEDLCQAMEDMAEIKKSWAFFNRDAAMLRDADAVLITTSLRSLTDPADINCNMCGKLVCEYLKEEEKLPPDPEVAFRGPLCIFRANNIAYAVDGMISQARNLGIDYGVYWSAGAAAMRMKILPKATGFALAVAISITEKSPFRDIPRRYAEINQRTMNDRMIQRLWPQFRSIYS
jgi:uncharacterized ferredoxin-like protein